MGNIVPAKDLPEGVYVSNVELHRGDGGRYARTAGSYAIVVGKSEGKVILRLPSGKIKEIDENALVTVGTVAGGGS